MENKKPKQVNPNTAPPHEFIKYVDELEIYVNKLEEQLRLYGVSNYPSELYPVLAKIEHINSLGKSSWYEVVYFDKHWRCYDGSSTFKDGEKVVKWRYCKDCL